MGGDGGETKQCTLDVVNTHRGLMLARELEAHGKLFAYNLPSSILHVAQYWWGAGRLWAQGRRKKQ
jgi:hypothetical protein